MTDKVYAYQRWHCSECDGELIEERNGDADLHCEVCGHLFKSSMGGFADYIPHPEDEPDLSDDECGGYGS